MEYKSINISLSDDVDEEYFYKYHAKMIDFLIKENRLKPTPNNMEPMFCNIFIEGDPYLSFGQYMRLNLQYRYSEFVKGSTNFHKT